MVAPLKRGDGVPSGAELTSAIRRLRDGVRLRFRDPAVEEAWRPRREHEARIPVRYGLLSFGTVLLVAALGDPWQAYEGWHVVVLMRLFVWPPVIFVGAWLVGHPRLRRHTLDVTFGVAVALTLSVLGLMTLWLGKDTATDYPMYWTVILLLVHVVTPLGLARATLAGAVVVGSYATTMLVHGIGGRHLAQHTVMIVVSWSILIAASWLFEKQARQTFLAQRRLTAAKEEAEQILRSILPGPVVERLKTSDRAIVDQVDEATVLFADLVDFTRLSRPLSAEALVDLLDGLFTCFERLTAKHGVDKIKTIGDAFMAATGTTGPSHDGTRRMADLALDMLREVEAYGRERGLPLRLRIGIHSGPVVAGILGRSRYAYDLWGDVVNVASRLESHGEPDHVHVSRAVKEALEGRYALTSRGLVHIRSVGFVETWWLGERL